MVQPIDAVINFILLRQYYEFKRFFFFFNLNKFSKK